MERATIDKYACPILIIGICLLLNCSVISSHYSTPIALATTCLALYSPYSLLAWLVCSTIVPDPCDAFLSNTQAIVCLMPFYLLFTKEYRYSNVDWGTARFPVLCVLGWLVLLLTSIAYHFDTDYGINIAKVALVFFMFIPIVFNRKIDIEQCVAVMFYANVVGGASALLRYVGIEAAGMSGIILDAGRLQRVSGGKCDPNAIGLSLAPLIIAGVFFLLSKSRRHNFLGIGVLVWTTPAFIDSLSRGIIVAVTVGASLLLLLKIKSLSFVNVVFAMLLVAIILLFNTLPSGVTHRISDYVSYSKDKGLGGRGEYWEQALKATSDHPLMGVGYANYLNATHMAPHNTIADYAVASGCTERDLRTTCLDSSTMSIGSHFAG